jgi:hypothetical protein
LSERAQVLINAEVAALMVYFFHAAEPV